jgi:prepilin peptidase CpaA
MNEPFAVEYGVINIPGLFHSGIQLLLLAALVVIAAILDFRTHRIPNWLVLAGVATGLAWQMVYPALVGGGLGFALKGMLVGFALLLPLYLLRAMGAGDVKLMAMVGTFLGPWDVASAALLSFIAGGVIALAVSAAKGALGQLFTNVKSMLFGTLISAFTTGRGTVDAPAASVGKVPFGVAIALGTLTQIVLAHKGLSLF